MNLELLAAFTPQVLQILLFLVMLGMGMTLTIQDFKRVVFFPKAVAVGLSNQIILLPIIAYGLVQFLDLSPSLALGLMLLSACPGGATSNLVSHLSKGDTALSISLTALSSIITIFTIPFIINWSLDLILGESGANFRLPILPTIINIFKLTALPVIIGMWVKHKFPDFVEKSAKALAIGSGIVILLALAMMLFRLSAQGNVWDFIIAAGSSVICMNLATLAVGFGSAWISGLSYPQRITISLESSMQNGVLGMAIATAPSLLNHPEAAVTSGVYGIAMVSSGAALIYLFRKFYPKGKEQLEGAQLS
ncbi:MAG: bile acid:sodium symporter family protein [Bacteroidota bacterium]